MRTTQIADYLTAEKVQEQMLCAKSKEQFQRWQVIYVIKVKGFTPDEAADVVGVTKWTVHQWVKLSPHSGDTLEYT